MSPRAADLDPKVQRAYAYSCLKTLNADERHEMLWYMAQHYPDALLISAEAIRQEAQERDKAWNQG